MVDSPSRSLSTGLVPAAPTYATCSKNPERWVRPTGFAQTDAKPTAPSSQPLRRNLGRPRTPVGPRRGVTRLMLQQLGYSVRRVHLLRQAAPTRPRGPPREGFETPTLRLTPRAVRSPGRLRSRAHRLCPDGATRSGRPGPARDRNSRPIPCSSGPLDGSASVRTDCLFEHPPENGSRGDGR